MRCFGTIKAQPDDVALYSGELGGSRPYPIEHGAELIRHREASILFRCLPSFVAGERGTLHFIEQAQRLDNATFGALVLAANDLFRASPVAEQEREKLALMPLGTRDQRPQIDNLGIIGPAGARLAGNCGLAL